MTPPPDDDEDLCDSEAAELLMEPLKALELVSSGVRWVFWLGDFRSVRVGGDFWLMFDHH